MPIDSFPKVERTSWGYKQWALHRSSKGATGFVGHNLVGVDKAKPGCYHILGFSDVGKLLTLPNIDNNFTPLSAMLLILTALILEMILDSEFL